MNYKSFIIILCALVLLISCRSKQISDDPDYFQIKTQEYKRCTDVGMWDSLYHSVEPSQKESIIYALANIQTPEFDSLLTQFWDSDTSGNIQSAALFALGQLQNHSGEKRLLSLAEKKMNPGLYKNPDPVSGILRYPEIPFFIR